MNLRQELIHVGHDVEQDFEGLDFHLVGGAVRDHLLGKDIHDFDFVVVGETKTSMGVRGFDHIPAASFPVFHDDLKREFALARVEKSTGSGHNGFEMQTEDVSLEEDLGRRDLTVNSIAMSPSGEIVDPFGGADDLEEGVLRHTTLAFREDPLRILRLARFAARFQFEVATETKCLCRQLAPSITHLATERLAIELRKVFTDEDTELPSWFFRTLKDLGALEQAFPTVARMDRVPAGPEEFHQEGTVFDHTMMVLDEIARQSVSVRRPFMALAHDMGKLETDMEQWPHHHGHAEKGEPVVEEFGRRLRLSNEEVGVMKDAANEHMRFARLLDMRPSKVIRLVERLDNRSENASPEEMADLMVADGKGRLPQKNTGLLEHGARIETARSVIEDIRGSDVIEMHPDKEPGEWISDVLLQERVEAFKDRL